MSVLIEHKPQKQEPKLSAKKFKNKLKIGKLKSDIPEPELSKLSAVDPTNVKVTKHLNLAKNSSGLDTERLGNIGKFVNMTDEELFDVAPKGGEGRYNGLNDDQKDSRIVLVHRFHMRGWTNERIAEKLEVSTRMICKIKEQIKDLHKRSFTNIDLNEFLGETVAFFMEVRNMSMGMATDKAYSAKEQIAALKVASDTEMNKIRFLDYCGVFAHIRGNASVMDDVINIVPETDKDKAHAAMDEFALELFASK